jgi:hypothetical protein
LAHIFQTQGQYALGLQYLTDLSITENFSPDEVNMLSRISLWFVKDKGREINGLSALVIIKALMRMLQNSPFEDDSKKILYQLMQQGLFSQLLTEYLVGVDLHPQALLFNPREECVFWENVEMLVPTLPDIADAVGVDRDQILRDIESFPKSMVDARMADLMKFIENGREPMVRAAEKQSAQEDDRSNDEIYPLFRESMAMRGIANVDESIESLKDISGQSVQIFAFEPKVASIMLETISPNLCHPVVANRSTPVTAKLSPVFLNDKKRQFGPAGKTLTDYYNNELVEGAKQLPAVQDDTLAQNVPSVGKINNLIETINEQRKTAIKRAKYSAQKIERITHENYAVATCGDDALEPLKLPNALRVYGFDSAGKHGRKKALEYLKTNYPWFPEGKLDECFCHVRNYLSGVTSGRYFNQMAQALTPVTTAKADTSTRTNAWGDTLPLLGQKHKNTLEDNELTNNMLLFEYMTNIRPREHLVAKMKFIIDERSKKDCDTGALIQQIMGSGKTKVFLPFIITLLLNRGESLPMVVSHISQSPAVAMESPAILWGVGIRMDIIDMNCSNCSNPQAIRLLRERLEVAFKRQEIVQDQNSVVIWRQNFSS